MTTSIIFDFFTYLLCLKLAALFTKCVHQDVSSFFTFFQGFVQNQNRARGLKDPSVLPDLCQSHRRQLQVMLKNHNNLRDIRRRCTAAKEELSVNLHTRLRCFFINHCLK